MKTISSSSIEIFEFSPGGEAPPTLCSIQPPAQLLIWVAKVISIDRESIETLAVCEQLVASLKKFPINRQTQR